MCYPLYHMPRVLIDGSEVQNSQVNVSGSEARHLLKVLRVAVGDRLTAFAEDGREWPAEVQDVGATRVQLSLGSPVEITRESPLPLLLGVGITKGDRMDIIVRMTTEQGVHEIQPILTARSEVSDIGPQKLLRWEKIASEACKQSGRNRKPSIGKAVNLEAFITRCRNIPRKLVFWEEGGESLGPRLMGSGIEHTAVLIGPVGGLTAEEVESAKRAGFTPMTLGPRILRVETAAVSVVAALQTAWGDMG